MLDWLLCYGVLDTIRIVLDCFIGFVNIEFINSKEFGIFLKYLAKDSLYCLTKCFRIQLLIGSLLKYSNSDK